jgi:putative DNA primase/helicase
MEGDKRKMLKLLAIGNGILKHRLFDLQMFIHLIGKPGSGKGKYARFCQKLVGKDNTIACQLDRLADGSTKASLIDKQLVVFPDERKPVGIDSILSLTGGDEISYRELYQSAASAHFYGGLLICSNKPIFVGDTTGLERRLCLVGFDNPIATDKRDHSLESELDSEIPAFIAIALSLSDSAVTQAIQGRGTNQIVEFRAKEWEKKSETDSIAAFFDSGLVLDPAATTTVGKHIEANNTI